jgi:hypothetical protein
MASIFFMSGNRRPFAELIFLYLPPIHGRKKGARKFDSLQADFLARYSRAWFI